MIYLIGDIYTNQDQIIKIYTHSLNKRKGGEKMPSRKHSVNENYFSVIDTEKKAYWLGFIYTDGCVMVHKNTGSKTLEITLNIQDINHLEEFRKDISASNPVKVINNGSACRISIHSKIIVDDLIRHGVIPRKSLTAIPPDDDLIPQSLQHHFIRGMFDGDGGFTKDKHSTYAVNFCGTLATCEYILKFFKKDIKIDTAKGITNFGQIRLKGNMQTKELCNVMYEDASTYLQRKHDTYLDFIEQVKQKQIKKEETFLEIQKQAIALSNKGYSGVQIAKVLKCSESQIYNYLKNHNQVDREGKKQKVLNLYMSGIENKSEIHRITGFSRDYIRKVLSE